MSDVNEVIPGTAGGLIETVKRGVIGALRVSLTGSHLSTGAVDKEVHVDLEYPAEAPQYPGIWVQFSLDTLKIAGIGHQKRTANSTIQEWMYAGKVTLTVVALTSLERDRIADQLITMFAFSREGGNSPLYSYFNDFPYVSLTINSDELIAGGQTTTIGVPWKEDQIGYEDNYSFNLIGQFQSETLDGEGVRLRRIDIFPEVKAYAPEIGSWV